MKLFSLLKNINCRVFGNTVIDIKGLYHNDIEVKEGGLFFCLRGTRVDGTDFVFSAVKNGAVAIVSEQEIQGLSGVTQIIVRNARETMSEIASKYYGDPASKMIMIGVTGTNGKTTVTNMIAEVIKDNVAVVGTNGIKYAGKTYETGMTTPDPIELQKYLAMMVRAKIKYVCIEVSAHAIDLHKIDGICFDAVVFTNLTEDHLDYFKTIQKYFETKAKLFTPKYAKFAVINADDEMGKILEKGINLPYVTYSICNNASFGASDLKIEDGYQSFILNSKQQIKLKMMGKFNVQNALSAISVLCHFGYDIETIENRLFGMEAVAGRFNIFHVHGKMVIVDYAHTPDGLKNILLSAKELAKQNKVISVFGCGGNRETQKRAIMGEISAKYADFTIITSDNPRFEKRENIASDIASGIKTDNFSIVLDRKEAIKDAVKMAKSGDIVVVAGKGTENYIDENGTKTPYSDIAEIKKLEKENEWILFAYKK